MNMKVTRTFKTEKENKTTATENNHAPQDYKC